LRFNAVGAAGIAVQLGTLALLKSGFGMHYLWATALAVEAAVLNNYFWHVRWTWRDRAGRLRVAEHSVQMLKFHLGNGAVSLVVNLALMRWLAGSLGMNYLAANILAIAAGGVANFLISDRLVFLSRRASRNC
jgi:dolichol-phosphate mannosyltransferase